MALGPASDHYPLGVERRNSVGGLPAYPPKPNSEYQRAYPGSQNAGDKLRAREGNNPDRLPRSLNPAQCERKLDSADSQDVGLEAATISKVRNSLPVEPSRAENDGDSSVAPQSRIRKNGRRASSAAVKRDRKDPWSADECVCRNE